MLCSVHFVSVLPYSLGKYMLDKERHQIFQAAFIRTAGFLECALIRARTNICKQYKDATQITLFISVASCFWLLANVMGARKCSNYSFKHLLKEKKYPRIIQNSDFLFYKKQFSQQIKFFSVCPKMRKNCPSERDFFSRLKQVVLGIKKRLLR